MDIDIILFVVAFVAPMIWFRVLISISPSYAEKPFTRSVLKIRWHHLHYGALFVLVGSILTLLTGITSLSIVLTGLGLGLIMDLFIPSFMLETDRKHELIIYRKSLLPTIFLFIAVVVVVIASATIFST